MVIGIDINSDVLRFVEYINDDTQFGMISGIQGLPPRLNEPFIWNNPRATRRSYNNVTISLADLWHKFHIDPDSTYQWNNELGIEQEISVSNLIADAIVQNLPQCKTLKTVIAISNLLSEKSQDRLISGMKNAGVADCSLLWRPIAIALAEMEEMREQYNESDKLFIYDYESAYPEITKLDLKIWHEILLPKRSLPESGISENKSGIDLYSLRRAIAHQVSNGDSGLYKQLTNGSFANQFINFTEGVTSTEFWHLSENCQYHFVDLKDSDVIDLINKELKTIRDETIEKLGDINRLSSSTILFHGLPFRLVPDMFRDYGRLINPTSVAEGACAFGVKLINGKPTYLDMLPGLEVLCQSTETKSYQFFNLIKKGEVAGGEVRVLKEPRTEFNLKNNIDQFTVVLRTIHDEACKKLTTQLPNRNRGEDVPLLLRAKMQPANGHAKVTIEGAPGFETVFGDRRRIKLDWSSMEPYVIDTYSGPEVYPVVGRIIDDPDCLELVRHVIENDLSMNDEVNFLNHTVKFSKVFEPWGYKWPWNTQLKQPTRGLFGAKSSDNDEIIKLADQLATIIDHEDKSNWYKHFNQMFWFTPERFLKDLRNIYTENQPPIDNWNMAFAPGRVFYKAEDFELFLDFIIRISNNGYPNYPDESYVAKYIWSYFRALCYYEATINVNIDKVKNVLNCIHKYIRNRARDDWLPRQGEIGRYARRNVENVKKFCLCAILFSLRFRKVDHHFLEPRSKAFDVVAEDIQQMIGDVRYPTTMFETEQPDRLNDYVYRFLACEATEQDYSALEGLTTSMS